MNILEAAQVLLKVVERHHSMCDLFSDDECADDQAQEHEVLRDVVEAITEAESV